MPTKSKPRIAHYTVQPSPSGWLVLDHGTPVAPETRTHAEAVSLAIARLYEDIRARKYGSLS